MRSFKYYRVPLIAFLTLLLSTFVSHGQIPLWYQCVKTDNAPIIDGSLNDPAWEKAQWSSAFIDIRDSTYETPEFETRFKMCWDDQNLYVAAWLEEPHLRGRLKERDTVIFYDNDFEIFLDPDGDHHQYAELEVNALNTHWDLMLTQPYRKDGTPIDAWDIRDLKKAVGLYGTINDPADRDSGWVVEWAIPMLTILELYTFDSIPESGATWKINFTRVQWPVNLRNGYYTYPTEYWQEKEAKNSVWSPQGRINMHLPDRWGLVILVEENNLLDQLPDTTYQLEALRYDLMQIYNWLFEFEDDNDFYPESCEEIISSGNFLLLEPELLVYTKTPLGYDLTYPMDTIRTIRLTDNCLFQVHKPDTD